MDHEQQFWEDCARFIEDKRNHAGKRVVGFYYAPWVMVEECGGIWYTLDFLGHRIKHSCRELAETYAELIPCDWLRAIEEAS